MSQSRGVLSLVALASLLVLLLVSVTEAVEWPRRVVLSGASDSLSSGARLMSLSAGFSGAGIATSSGYRVTLGFWNTHPVVTSVEEPPVVTPYTFKLFAVRPNPVHSRAEIIFELPAKGATSLDIYDVRGRLIRRLIRGIRDAGVHTVPWDGCDESGREVSWGVYLLMLRTIGHETVQKIVVAG